MASFKDYCPDAELTSAGVKLHLLEPDGKMGNQFVLVRWRYSDEVRAALDNLQRQGLKRIKAIHDGMPKKEKNAATRANRKVERELIMDGMVALVAGWSFDEDPTPENIKAFLAARPDLVKRIETRSMQDQFFFTSAGKT